MDNDFIKHFEARGQTIKHCAVKSHFQNSRSEKAIPGIQTAANMMLFHAKSRCPDAIHLYLFTYAMHMVAQILNNAPNSNDGRSRFEAFARIAVSPKYDHYHTFGWPVYRLTMQAATSKYTKWQNKENLMMYLGPSPPHEGSVSLVLSLTSAMASPQFPQNY